MRAASRIATVLCLAALVCGCPVRCGDTVFFLVSELMPTHGDSYVLPLTDPGDIAQARAIIADPEGTAARIVVAKIAPCGDLSAAIKRDSRRGFQPRHPSQRTGRNVVTGNEAGSLVYGGADHECNYVNRDFLNGGKPWSWCVTEFDGFAENTIEILDGWPTYVDENLDAWMGTTGGAIGFWSYTVTRELTPWETFAVRCAHP